MGISFVVLRVNQDREKFDLKNGSETAGNGR